MRARRWPIATSASPAPGASGARTVVMLECERPGWNRPVTLWEAVLWEAVMRRGPNPDGEATSSLAGGSGRHVRPRRHTRLAIGIGVGVIVVGAGAGIAVAMSSGGKSDPKAVPAPTPTTSVAPGPPCPLTGAPSPSGSVPPRPALAMKIDNYPAARPQSGLDKADIVFEEPVEGGITRLVAVFQCQDPGLVGPLRSARYPDVGIIDQLSTPIFVHVGGIDPIVAMIRQAQTFDDNLLYGGPVEHLPGRYAPYDTYLTGANGWRYKANDTTPPAPLFSYSPAPSGGTPVSSVHIPFSSTSNETWRWSAAASHWDLSYSGVAATVSSGAPVTAANVVVQTVQVSTGPWLENDVGGYEVEVNPTSGGAVEVLRNGVMVAGRWTRASIDSPMQLVGTDGQPIALAPGSTWVAMVPSRIAITSVPG